MTAATKSAYGEEWWKMHHIGASVCNECFLGLVFFFTATYLVPGSVNPACVKVDPENTVAIGQFSSTLSFCQLPDQQAHDIYEIEEKTMKSNTASTTTSWQCGCQDLWRPHRSSTGDVWPLIRETLSFKCKFHFSASCRKEVERKLQKTRKNSKSPGKGYSKCLQPEAYGCLLKWWRRDAAGEYILDSISSNPHRSDVGKPSNQPVLGIWLIGMVAGVFAELCTVSFCTFQTFISYFWIFLTCPCFKLMNHGFSFPNQLDPDPHFQGKNWGVGRNWKPGRRNHFLHRVLSSDFEAKHQTSICEW